MILSVPSYVIPGGYLENIRFLEDKSLVQNIELLFFMYDDDTRALVKGEWAAIRDYAQRFSYTLHLPDTILPEHQDLLDRTADFVDGYVVHPPRDPAGLDDFVSLYQDWQTAYGRPLRLENTRLPQFHAALQALEAFRPPLCADLGHLLAEGQDPCAWLDEYGQRIEEIHLHGLVDGRDHQPFTGREPWFDALRTRLGRFRGVVELEVFDWKHLEPMLEALEAL